VAAKKELVHELARRFRKAFAEPKTELYFRTPFQLLVSVVLSAQTTDKMVNASMKDAYDSGFTPEAAVKLGPEGILRLIRRVGLAPTKSKRVHELAGILLEKYAGEVPRTREELEALPGVGRKTANVVLAELYGEPTLAVDTHVFRVSRRLGLHDAKTADQCEEQLMKLFDKKYLPTAHHWLILHGRYTCTALRPKCDTCILNDICPSL
jgi:endonuclease-3